ncbi:hypothetical protein pdam_00018710 [Pocillopora damicornis]|uniref:Fibrillar collagen NC1 domain-containing protein n=1 Tax=Pocillopora damicornis TaxID=46731 RepID=A0A3M6TYQ9_POCDA|nr:collagen EMF1-alpha-like [Pocillopora damicornis]RMX46522.1 hypothetical protein pdam_00018710 [Pocillopora damicornis]
MSLIFIPGNYWLDPNGGCAEDAFQAECKFSAGGQTCIYPNQLQGDNSREILKFSYEASPTQFKFLKLLSKQGVQDISHECLSNADDLTISTFNGQKITTDHPKCTSGQNEVHSIDQKDLLPLKDISTTQQKPVKFELGPVCFQ